MSELMVAGVDEVGRGPLAGAVVAAAVILDPQQPIDGLMDSKKLSENKREKLAGEIREKSLAWGLGRAEVEEIDQLNILQASLLAMRRAVLQLTKQPQLILVDGKYCPKLDDVMPTAKLRAIIKGDQTEPSISAASILAKVTRDAEMRAFEQTYPGYGFAKHKGYPTKQHLAALQQLGISPIHRLSFRPVRELLEAPS